MGRVLILRHGQASFGAADYDQLSDLGVEQAETTGAALAARGVRPDLIVRGRLRRHDQTTRALCRGAGWEDVEVRSEAAWDEIDHLAVMTAHGESPDHQDSRVFQVAYERALDRWMGASEHGDLETFASFTTRVATALRGAADQAGPGRTVLVVSSAGPLGAACATLMHPGFPETDPQAWLPWNTVAVNCGLTTVVVGRRGTRLLSFNEQGHLPGEAVTFR